MRRSAAVWIVLLWSFAGLLPSTHGQTPAGPGSQPSDLCKRLGAIRLMPFEDEHVDDEVYNQIMAKGQAMVPCLIEQLTNEAIMPDPRMEPGISNFKVGDVAFFLLLRITHVPFDQLLPKEVIEAWKKEGVYAYFGYTHGDHAHRVELQARWKAWLAARTPKRQVGICSPL